MRDRHILPASSSLHGLAASLAVAVAIGCGGGTGGPALSTSVDESSTADGITADDLARYTRELADDALQGRGPGGEGEAATLEYLQAAYQRIGLSPMGGSRLPGAAPGAAPYFQEVRMVGITADPETARLAFGGSPQTAALELEYGRDFVTWTAEPEAVLDVVGGIVFVGYGIDAPEEGWNDFRDVDVTGKILLVLVNDPPLEDQTRNPKRGISTAPIIFPSRRPAFPRCTPTAG